MGCTDFPVRTGDEKPDCECHGEPMWWHSDPRRRAEGYWRCSVKERERSLRRREADPVAWNRYHEERRREQRISRLENELKELINAT